MNIMPKFWNFTNYYWKTWSWHCCTTGMLLLSMSKRWMLLDVWLEQLTAEEKLNQMGAKVLKTYNAVFNPCLHTDNLPTDMYCHIKLKDAQRQLLHSITWVPRHLDNPYSITCSDEQGCTHWCPDVYPHPYPWCTLPLWRVRVCRGMG